MTGGLVAALVTALVERSAGGSGAAELAPERRHERVSAVLVDRLGDWEIGSSRAGARQASSSCGRSQPEGREMCGEMCGALG